MGGDAPGDAAARAEPLSLRPAGPSVLGASCHGVRFTLTGADDRLLRELSDRLPRLDFAPSAGPAERRYEVGTASPGGPVELRRGAGRLVRVASPGEAAELIAADLQRTVALRAAGLVLVHAGVVARDGRALLLPGPSGSGKTRLVEALLRRGADYLSDELALLDHQGRVHPWARPLARRTDDGGVRRLDPAELGARTRRRPVAVSAIAFLRFSPKAAQAPWRPRTLTPGEALLRLLRQTVAARRRLELARAVLLPIAATTLVLAATRGEADEAAAQLSAAVW